MREREARLDVGLFHRDTGLFYRDRTCACVKRDRAVCRQERCEWNRACSSSQMANVKRQSLGQCLTQSNTLQDSATH